MLATRENEMAIEGDVSAPVTGDLQTALDRALHRSNDLYRMVLFLRQHDGECVGDHPAWIAGIDKLLDGQHFDALTELVSANGPST